MLPIHLDVEFYDEEQQRLFLRQDNPRILQLVENGLTIDEEQFFINACFKHQQDSDGFRTRDDLKRFVPRLRGSMLPLYFDLENGTVRSVFVGQNQTDNYSTEVCGVGATLSIVSGIYGLTEADWEKIDIGGRQDLDFKTKASDGARFIVTEAKGRIVRDLDRLTEVSGAKHDILEKKAEQRLPDSRDIYLGVIAAFPIEPGRRAKCRLVDPIIEDVPVDPRKYKLLARLAHYHRELGVITRAQFLVALANRIQAMSLVDDYEAFDRLRLINDRGEPFRLPESIFHSRSVVEDDIAFGEAIPLGDGTFFFYGLVTRILNLMIGQDHAAIIGYQATTVAKSTAQLVRARIPEDELTAANIPIADLKKVPNSTRREIRMIGELTTTRGGHVLGPLRAATLEERRALQQKRIAEMVLKMG